MLRGRQKGLEREGGDLSPLSSLPKTISHIIQASMEGRTEGTILGGLTPSSQFRTIAPLGPQGDGQHPIAGNEHFACQNHAEKQDIRNALQISGAKILSYAKKKSTQFNFSHGDVSVSPHASLRAEQGLTVRPSVCPVGGGRLDSRSVECLNGLAAAEGSVGVVGVKT